MQSLPGVQSAHMQIPVLPGQESHSASSRGSAQGDLDGEVSLLHSLGGLRLYVQSLNGEH